MTESGLKQRLLAPLAIISLFLLNLLFQLPVLAGQGGGFSTVLNPSADAFLLALILCLYAWLRLPGERVFLPIAALLCLSLLIFRTADALVPRLFDRQFALRTDITYIPELYALIYDTTSHWLFYAGLILLVLALAGLGFGLAIGFRLLHRGLQTSAYRYTLLLLLAVFSFVDLATPWSFFANSSLPRVAEELGRAARYSQYVQERRREFQQRAVEAQRQSVPLDRLEGRSVYLFLVESYGYTLYSEPAHFALVEGALGEIAEKLSRAGYRVCSNFLTSTAFGGNSWLADSTLTTGVRIDSQAAYETLLKSKVKPLAAYFNAAGYRTVIAMPGTTTPWPEGDYFSFGKKYYFLDFGYRGPSLKWAPMTDQYALDAIYRKEVASARQPLFIQYVLISSHFPFNLIPRYFEDWSALGDGSIYGREDSVRVLPIKPGNTTAGPEGYAAAIEYDLRLLEQYLTKFIADESLIIILGDHQPFSGITGQNEPWSVPIHLLSRRGEFLEPFLRRGYTPGLIPGQPLPHKGLETFLPGFLEDFSSGAPRPRVEAGRAAGAGG